MIIGGNVHLFVQILATQEFFPYPIIFFLAIRSKLFQYSIK